MKAYYDLVDKLNTYLDGSPSVNTVTFGDIFKVDLSKQTIFPLAHINIQNVTFSEHIMTFSLQVICMDIVNENKDDKLAATSTPYRGLDNKHDVFNTQLTVINGLQSSLRRGDLYTDKYQLVSDATATQFEDRFENLLAGWSMDLVIETANTDMQLINATGDACR
jgi:hypothetical protein|tara:strand:+ start:2504 stop:2998 length:495 start_codon:yes stop_codon:yes gene_type:complete